MSKYGYIARIELEIDGKDAEGTLKDIEVGIRKLDREINSTNKSIKAANQAGIDSTEMYRQKETELAAVIEKTREKLDGLKSVERR